MGYRVATRNPATIKPSDGVQFPAAAGVMDIVIFRTIFFELLVFFTFTLFTLHSVY